ncbi:MAG: hypothetical protein KDC92_08770 [Bacteroidetes bacterium]|nr:hypothetical protein [Bacteroidota bacterium]
MKKSLVLIVIISICAISNGKSNSDNEKELESDSSVEYEQKLYQIHLERIEDEIETIRNELDEQSEASKLKIQSQEEKSQYVELRLKGLEEENNSWWKDLWKQLLATIGALLVWLVSVWFAQSIKKINEEEHYRNQLIVLTNEISDNISRKFTIIKLGNSSPPKVPSFLQSEIGKPVLDKLLKNSSFDEFKSDLRKEHYENEHINRKIKFITEGNNPNINSSLHDLMKLAEENILPSIKLQLNLCNRIGQKNYQIPWWSKPVFFCRSKQRWMEKTPKLGCNFMFWQKDNPDYEFDEIKNSIIEFCRSQLREVNDNEVYQSVSECLERQ